MSQAVATANQKQGMAVDHFLSVFITDDRRDQITRALPKHISYDRFERNLLNALMSNWELASLDQNYLWREVAKAAQLGLLLDPLLGEAYLIAAYDGRANKKVPQLRVGYRGLIKMARQSGDILTVYAHEVRENDKIECHLGDDKRLIHEPKLFGSRGDVIGYYAVVKYKNGETDFEPMNREEVERIRDEKSDGYRAFKADKIKSTPWDSDFDEMAKKTCIRRLLKRVPQSPDLQNALTHEDALDYGATEMRDVTPQTPRPERDTYIGPPANAGAGPEPEAEPAETTDEDDGPVEGEVEPFTFINQFGELRDEPLTADDFVAALCEAMDDNDSGAAIKALLDHNEDAITSLPEDLNAQVEAHKAYTRDRIQKLIDDEKPKRGKASKASKKSDTQRESEKPAEGDADASKEDDPSESTKEPQPSAGAHVIEPETDVKGKIMDRASQSKALKVINAAPDAATIDAILEANKDWIDGLPKLYRDAVRNQAEKRKGALPE